MNKTFKDDFTYHWYQVCSEAPVIITLQGLFDIGSWVHRYSGGSDQTLRDFNHGYYLPHF
jgi:hypothetical protein